MVCSLGLAFAMLATILLYSSGGILFTELIDKKIPSYVVYSVVTVIATRDKTPCVYYRYAIYRESSASCGIKSMSQYAVITLFAICIVVMGTTKLTTTK